MNFASLSPEKTGLLLIGLTFEGEMFQKKLELFEDKISDELSPVWKELIAQLPDERKKLITSTLKSLHRSHNAKFFHDVHPDWILKKIQSESPHVIGAVLRFLPGDYAKYILEKMPAESLALLPKLKDTFHVDPHLIEFIRLKLQEAFFLPNLPHQKKLIAALSEWPMNKTHAFFRELGFKELAMAFSSLPQKVSRALLSRMSAAEGEEVSRRISVTKAVSESRVKKSQGHLLSLDLGETGSNHLVIEAGFFVYSKTLLAPLGPEFIAIERKLPLELASILRKYAEKNVTLNFPEIIEPYVEEVEELMAQFNVVWHQIKREKTIIR